MFALLEVHFSTFQLIELVRVNIARFLFYLYFDFGHHILRFLYYTDFTGSDEKQMLEGEVVKDLRTHELAVS